MLKNLGDVKIGEFEYKILKANKYNGENNLFDIIQYFEDKLNVYFNRKVEVDTDDDDYYPKNFAVYYYQSVYQPSYSWHHTLCEVSDTDEKEALVKCVEYAIVDYDTYIKELDEQMDEDSLSFNIMLDYNN